MANPTGNPSGRRAKNRAGLTRRFSNLHNPYAHLIEQFPDILYRYKIGSPGKFEFINPAIKTLTGLLPDDFLQDPLLIFEKIHPDDRHLLENCLVNLKCSSPVILRWLGADHSPIWTEHRVMPVFDPTGMMIAIEGVFRNISHQSLQEDINPLTNVVSHLISLGKALEKPSSLNEIAEIIGISVKHLCQADAGLLLKLSSADNQLLCLWSDGIGKGRINSTAQQIYLALKEKPAEHSNWIMIKNPDDDIGNFHSMMICPLTYEKNLRGGLACFHINPRRWEEPELSAIEAFVRQAAISLENIQLGRDLQESYLHAIIALSKTMKVRDVYTSDHSNQMVGWAETLAWKLGCRTRDIESIRWAAMLHDIGKIGIPDIVLGKPSSLNEDEWKLMKRHPQIGAEIVGVMPQMRKVSPLIKYHHEHFDGSGYPEGLNGDQIPLGARILAVVDAYSAMTSDRVYRPARLPNEARDELVRTSGTQFDPRVVTTFLQMMNPGHENSKVNQTVN